LPLVGDQQVGAHAVVGVVQDPQEFGPVASFPGPVT